MPSRPSSSTIERLRLSAAACTAGAPGSANSVGVKSGPPEASSTSPKSSTRRFSVAESASWATMRMPSSRSRAVPSAGSVSGVAAGWEPPSAQIVSPVTSLSSVRPKNSTTVPATRIVSPASSSGAFGTKTNRPSDVSARPSPCGSWMNPPPRSPEPVSPSKSPTTTPSTVTSWPAIGLSPPAP